MDPEEEYRCPQGSTYWEFHEASGRMWMVLRVYEDFYGLIGFHIVQIGNTSSKVFLIGVTKSYYSSTTFMAFKNSFYPL